jgi:two-component system NtrC family response regulator
MEEYKILIIDDDELVGVSLKKALKKIGYDAYLCQDPNEINSMINEIDPDLILLDIYLSEDVNGIDVLKSLVNSYKQIPIVMITGYADVQIAVNAMKIGAKDFLLKPVDMEQLKFILEKNLEPVKLRKQVLKLQQLLQEGPVITRDYFGKSEKIQKVLNLAEKFAQTDNTTILIEGESGTGKEVMAKFIHSMSPRRQGPFITVNCGAIPKELAESELFGYEKGAFTGAASKTKLGKFELADNGTLLLDEIGELPLDLQVKLLRVLQEKKFFRLGGEKEVAVNVRIIAATNRNLEKEVEEKRFREDLFYRLNVGKIYLPPLRERKEDIPLLATMFIEEICNSCNIEVKNIESSALNFLKEVTWKGNIRELRNAIERAIILSNGNTIKFEDFSFLKEYDDYVEELKYSDDDLEEFNDTDDVIFNNDNITLSDYHLSIPKNGITIDQVMKDLIVETLKLTKGNQLKAAKILGLSRAKLRYRIEQLKIDLKQFN